MSINARPGFNWKAVNWGAPDEPVSETCSYCLGPIPEESVPLRMWREDGWAAVFCDDCAKRWFGFETFPDDEDP